MSETIIAALIVAAVTGVASGLVTWGMTRMELKWLRRDVDAAHARINKIEGRDNRAGFWPVDG